jgi:hypothetical protein
MTDRCDDFNLQSSTSIFRIVIYNLYMTAYNVHIDTQEHVLSMRTSQSEDNY